MCLAEPFDEIALVMKRAKVEGLRVDTRGRVNVKIVAFFFVTLERHTNCLAAVVHHVDPDVLVGK